MNSKWTGGVLALLLFLPAAPSTAEPRPRGPNLVEEMRSALAAGELERAKAAYRTGLAAFSRDPESRARLHFWAGMEFAEAGRWDVAVQASRRAVELRSRMDPTSEEALQTRMVLVKSLLGAGRAEEARRHAEWALQASERFPARSQVAAWTWLGVAQQQCGDGAGAMKSVQRAIELIESVDPDAPELVEAYESLGGWKLAEADWPEASLNFGKALRILELTAPNSVDTARLHARLSQASDGAGHLQHAVEHAQRCLDILVQGMPEHPEILACLQGTGRLLVRAGFAEEAVARCRAVSERLTQVAPRSSVSALVLLEAADLLLAQGRPDEALGEARTALARARKAGNADAIRVIEDWLLDRLLGQARWEEMAGVAEAALKEVPPSLPPAAAARRTYAAGLAHLNLGARDRALGLLHRAASLHRQAGPNALDVQPWCNIVGFRLRELGLQEEACKIVAQALQAWPRGSAPQVVQQEYQLLGLLCDDLGRYREAIEWYGAALELLQDGEEPVALARLYHNMGVSYGNYGDVARGRELLEKSVALKEVHQPESLSLAETLCSLGVQTRSAGDPRKALEILARGEALARIHRPDSPLLALFWHNQSMALLDCARFTEAEDAQRRALSLHERLAPGSAYHIVALSNMAHVHWRRGDLTKAVNTYRQALELEARLPRSRPRRAGLCHNLGVVLNQQGHSAAAIPWLLEALELRRAGGTPQDLASTLAMLADARMGVGRYDEAGDYLDEAFAALASAPPDSRELATALTTRALLRKARGELDLAFEDLQESLRIRQLRVPGTFEESQSHNFLGQVLAQLERPDAANHHLQEALRIVRAETPNSVNEAQVRVFLVWVAPAPEAEEHARVVMEILASQAPQSLLRADVLTNLAGRRRNRGRYAEAEGLARQAVELRQEKAPNSLGMATDYEALAQILQDRGDLAGARKHYREALTIRERLCPGSLAHAKALNNLAHSWWRSGELDEALPLHRQALELRLRYSRDSLAVANSYNNLGLVHDSRGEKEVAERYYRGALEIFTRRAPGSLELAQAHNNVALCLDVSSPAALRQFLEAARILESIAPEHLDLATIYANIGRHHLAAGALSSAEDAYRRAFELQKKQAPNSAPAAFSMEGLAAVAEARGESAEALDWRLAAVALLETAAPRSERLAAARRDLARLLRRLGRDDEALAMAEKASHAFTALPSEGLAWNARASLRAGSHDAWALAAQLRASMDDPEAALDHAEAAHARALRETLAARAGQALAQRLSPPELAEQRKRLQAELSAVQAKLTAHHRAGRSAPPDVLLEQARLEMELEVLNREQLASHPGRLVEAGLLQARDVAARLGPGELLVEFVNCEDGMLVLRADAREGVRSSFHEVDWKAVHRLLVRWEAGLVSPSTPQRLANEGLAVLLEVEDSVKGPRLRAEFEAQTARPELPRLLPLLQRLRLELPPEREDLATQLDALVRDAENYRPATPEDMRELGQSLGSTLLPAELVKEMSSAASVILVPDGNLVAIPWGLLHDGEGWLFEKVAFTQAPSFSVLSQLGTSSPLEPTASILALGAPLYPPSAILPGDPTRPISTTVVVTKGFRGTSYPPLVHAAEELESVKRYFPRAEVLTGEQAGESAFYQLAPGKRIVHLAAHAVTSPERPLDSAVILSLNRPDETSADSDGYLSAGELLAWEGRLDADLAVLSACRTARGRVLRGEGVVGLTGAFLGSGCRNVLVSLWDVDDASTAGLMAAFYRELARGSSGTLALRTAMDEIRRQPQWRHPYYWGGFILVGRGLPGRP